MNILKQQLRIGRKAFILWSIGLFFIMFAGMAKYTGFNGDTNVTEIFDAFPKIVLAVFGMVGVDISSLGGFYAIVVYYGVICAAIYGVSLGCAAVNREAIDKTYEFIFTKPRSRSFILRMKLLSAFIYISLFSILSYVFSMAAISTLDIDNTIKTPVLLFSISLWLVGLLFCTLAACICSIIKKSEKGILYSNLTFILAFVLGMVYDMLENGNVIKIFSPFKYFSPADVLDGKLDIFYVILCIVLSVIFYIVATIQFEKRDLQS